MALIMCLVGGAALIRNSYEFSPEHLPGDLFGVVTSVFFGSYVLAVRAAREKFNVRRFAFLSTTTTAIFLFVIAAFSESTLLPSSFEGALTLCLLAFVSQVIGQGFLALALGSLPATFSSLVIFLEAVAAAAFGWILIGEAISLAQALGGFLIVLGIYVGRPTRPKRSLAAAS